MCHPNRMHFCLNHCKNLQSNCDLVNLQRPREPLYSNSLIWINIAVYIELEMQFKLANGLNAHEMRFNSQAWIRFTPIEPGYMQCQVVIKFIHSAHGSERRASHGEQQLPSPPKARKLAKSGRHNSGILLPLNTSDGTGRVPIAAEWPLMLPGLENYRQLPASFQDWLLPSPAILPTKSALRNSFALMQKISFRSCAPVDNNKLSQFRNARVQMSSLVPTRRHGLRFDLEPR